MIQVESTIPLYIGGRVATEFETTESHFRELVRVHGADKVKEATGKPPAKQETKAEAKKAAKP
ncbi:hypothetical protein HNP33_002071 [Comamonas odontotermitis]|uniref:Uncharacterized protein n=1 Tax=Comamonas odontotermitis TaxID=379895 RepID=A0ABR6RFS3_9BURK|nr:hypothetical protein [Comamonas odontotermitis]MBB6578003.1 hypothetical protein [Comamonas odontotermitis]